VQFHERTIIISASRIVICRTIRNLQINTGTPPYLLAARIVAPRARAVRHMVCGPVAL
jgi:hypothetical protein